MLFYFLSSYCIEANYHQEIFTPILPLTGGGENLTDEFFLVNIFVREILAHLTLRQKNFPTIT